MASGTRAVQYIICAVEAHGCLAAGADPAFRHVRSVRFSLVVFRPELQVRGP
ncbi:hypothetical protein SAMN05444164_3810 [Bradyrhizobium erythrophlei]|uniref:Uncharacterized protein n=1 Tax=Bradyrhizobium erythrophlei TaxID=1437360 RepID=A0A1H4Y8F1_9BRAD|nr:hypothetical protein SAMN05444164_3810 [Bradyrhizobium erythrophlei]